MPGRDAAMHAHARGHAAVRDRLLAAAPPKPPTRTASEVHPACGTEFSSTASGDDAHARAVARIVSADSSHGDDAEMVGLPPALRTDLG